MDMDKVFVYGVRLWCTCGFQYVQKSGSYRIMQIMDILDLDLWVLAAIVFPTSKQ